MVFIVQRNDVLQPQHPPSEADFVKPILARRRYPGLGECPVFMSERTPPSERASALTRTALRIVLGLKEPFGLSRSYPQIWTGSGSLFPKEFAALKPVPRRPQELADDADKLAGLARRGPFSVQTSRQPDGDFVLDLRHLQDLRPRAPFVRVGGLARFRPTSAGTLETVEIVFRGCSFRPGDPGWRLAEKRMLVALNTHTTVFEHLLYLHLIGGGTWSLCTQLALSPRHPLRVLLQPFTVENMRVNNDQIDGLLESEASNVPSYSGYPLPTIDAAIRAAAERFDVCVIHPERRARDQGQLDEPRFPTVRSLVRLWHIFREFAGTWCQAHLTGIDLPTRIWCEELDAKVPNGVRRLIGIAHWDDVTVDQVAELAAVCMFASSIGHHLVNDLTYDYLLQFDSMPPAINADGYPTLGVVYEKRNSIFIASVQRYLLMNAELELPTPTMRAQWSAFQAALAEYEAESRADPDHPYYVLPSQATASIHA